MNEFNKKLRLFIAEFNIKKQDFAQEIGVTPESISGWLHHNRPVNKRNAVKINEFTNGIITMEDMGY